MGQVELSSACIMAGSRYAYVRDFELADVALPRTFLVVRIDGKGFHKYALVLSP